MFLRAHFPRVKDDVIVRDVRTHLWRREKIARGNVFVKFDLPRAASGALFPPRVEGREREILSSARIGAGNITGFYECNGGPTLGAAHGRMRK